MTPLWAVFTFINLWWVCLFAFLALGNTYNRAPSAYDYAAAPDKPHLKRKFFYTTITSASITALIALLMHWDIINFSYSYD